MVILLSISSCIVGVSSRTIIYNGVESDVDLVDIKYRPGYVCPAGSIQIGQENFHQETRLCMYPKERRTMMCKPGFSNMQYVTEAGGVVQQCQATIYMPIQYIYQALAIKESSAQNSLIINDYVLTYGSSINGFHIAYGYNTFDTLNVYTSATHSRITSNSMESSSAFVCKINGYGFGFKTDSYTEFDIDKAKEKLDVVKSSIQSGYMELKNAYEETRDRVVFGLTTLVNVKPRDVLEIVKDNTVTSLNSLENGVTKLKEIVTNIDLDSLENKIATMTDDISHGAKRIYFNYFASPVIKQFRKPSQLNGNQGEWTNSDDTLDAEKREKLENMARAKKEAKNRLHSKNSNASGKGLPPRCGMCSCLLTEDKLETGRFALHGSHHTCRRCFVTWLDIMKPPDASVICYDLKCHGICRYGKCSFGDIKPWPDSLIKIKEPTTTTAPNTPPAGSNDTPIVSPAESGSDSPGSVPSAPSPTSPCSTSSDTSGIGLGDPPGLPKHPGGLKDPGDDPGQGGGAPEPDGPPGGNPWMPARGHEHYVQRVTIRMIKARDTYWLYILMLFVPVVFLSLFFSNKIRLYWIYTFDSDFGLLRPLVPHLRFCIVVIAFVMLLYIQRKLRRVEDVSHTRNRGYDYRIMHDGERNSASESANTLAELSYTRGYQALIYTHVYNEILGSRGGSALSNDLLRFCKAQAFSHVGKNILDTNVPYETDILMDTAVYAYQKILCERVHEHLHDISGKLDIPKLRW